MILLTFILLCIPFTDAWIPQSALNKILDEQKYNEILMPKAETDDDLLEMTKILAEKHFIATIEPKDCYLEYILKIDFLNQMKSDPSNYQDFIKDPCITILALYENRSDLEFALKHFRIPGHPYFFALNTEGVLVEVQIYSQKIVPVLQNETDITIRRYNLNGALVKVVQLEDDPFHKLLPAMEKRLNFSIKYVDFKGFGALNGERWNGVINQLIKHEVDVGKHMHFSLK